MKVFESEWIIVQGCGRVGARVQWLGDAGDQALPSNKGRSYIHYVGYPKKIGIIILRALTARPHKWQNVNRGLREAPFWNVLVLYGHCPNSFGPPPPLSNRQMWQKVPQTILASPYNPGHLGKKCPNHPGRPLHLPHPPYGQCPYANNTLQKGVSLT